MKLRAYQKSALRVGQNYGVVALLHRRQGGKTTILGLKSLRWMLQHPGCLVTYASCSLSVGQELTEREVLLLLDIIGAIKAEAAEVEKGAVQCTSSVDGLRWDDAAELFSKNKLEVFLYHSRTLASRTKIIAPSYATARGYTGFVILDEIGFIPHFDLFYEAVEPIFSSNPDFRLWMSTTPPADDSHYSYSLLAPEPGAVFPVSAAGNWYTSQAGVPVHRVSADDAFAAGLPFFHPRTRAKITPPEHRATQFDKDAWDRNYALAFPHGGTAAVQLLWLMDAMTAGIVEGCTFYEDELPAEWVPEFSGGVIGVGADPATTEGAVSNPFAICITERTPAGKYVARVVFRFKSADPAKCKAYLREIVEAVRPQALALDATSERFWCAEVRAELEMICPVLLVVSSEKTEYQGEKMNMKSYLGNLATNALEDRMAAVPNDARLKKDFRLVKRSRGGFDNDVDSSGNHGDTFDGFKLSMFAIVDESALVEAHAVDMRASFNTRAELANRMPDTPPDDDKQNDETEVKLWV